MKYQNTVTITTLSVIAVFAIASFAGFEIPGIDAFTAAVQPAKYVFVENISTTVEFKFRDATEVSPFQIFSQTAGFGTTTLEVAKLPKSGDSSERTGRAKPSFALEKNVGGTPYLYEAVDEAQKHILNSGLEFPYKYFDVTVYLHSGADVLRTFEYRDCKVTNYVTTTRLDNEEGYTGKGIVLVDQFAFECDGYTPLNPTLVKLESFDKAKTISSSDLRSTDKWEPGFSAQP